MPPRLHPINAATVARRLELHPGTVTLESAKAIYNRLGDIAAADGHHEVKVEAFAMAKAVQELIDTPKPDGLVASARLILAVDELTLAGGDLRADVARAYDRFDKQTGRATEALEILTAIGVLLEAADLDLRTGNRAA